MRQIELKLIPGDGIGVDVVAEGRRVLDAAAEAHGGVRVSYDELPWGCRYYLEHGRMMPVDGLQILEDCDAILLGAVGYPGVDDHVSLRGLLLPIRQGFDQYVNFRPIQLLPGLRSPLRAGPDDIDFVVVRENSEGEYCGVGRFENEGTAEETAVQEARFTRKGTRRILEYAFRLAVEQDRPHLVSATKSNALNYSMVFWDRIYDEVRQQYEGRVQARKMHVDALAGLFLTKPASLDVVVASNLFGDILTDLGSAMLGSIGISPSANVNPEKRYPGMFEPLHGSAPDIAGQGIANPIGTIWSIVLMLDHLELPDLSAALMEAMKAVIAEGRVRTPDLGGQSTTRQVADAIIEKLCP